MPAFLKNLKVKKVSFVSSPSTMKPFVLTKSKEDVTNKESQDSQTNKGVINTMDEKLRDQIQALLAKGTAKADVIAELKKSDEKNEISDELEKTIGYFLDLVETKEVEVKKEVEKIVEKKVVDPEAIKVVKSLQVELAELKKARSIDGIEAWLAKECAAYPGDAVKTAEKIYTLEEIDKDAGQIMRDAIKVSSDITAKEFLFRDMGKTVKDDARELGAIVDEVVKVEKAASAEDTAEAIEKAIFDDPEGFDKYRNEQIKRSHRQFEN